MTVTEPSGSVTYYKATDAKGRSFGNHGIVWNVGRIVSDPLPEGSGRLCRAGLLHAATAPTEALTSHVPVVHPFRLLAVEPRAAIVTDSDEPHKVGCRAWKVVAQMYPWQAYGPQGEEVMALIERCKRLTASENRRLGAATVQHAERYAVMDLSERIAGIAARSMAHDAAGSAAWRAARSRGDGGHVAALQAACALVVRDLVVRRVFDILYGPWASVIGE